jgi:MFS family permease
MSPHRLGPVLAVVIVFTTSAAVLVLEILAGRLLAPYTGVSLETYTGIIGTVLAAIAVGTAVGGRVADHIDPSRLLGPTLVTGGVLAWLSLPVLTWLGPSSGRGAGAIIVLAAAAFFLPAAVLSAASPMVAKLRLQDLDHTGSVVGGLSAAGTAGALVGTFATGFILIAALPTRPIVIGVGIALVLGGIALWWRLTVSRPSPAASAVILALMAGALGLGATSSSVCQWETGYFCARIEHDLARPSGRILWLDTLQHSYVDLEDPTHLEFRYMRVFAAVAGAMAVDRLDVLHVGGGGFTFPRYLIATRPASTHLVAEIDDELVSIVRSHLGLVTSPQLRVHADDARGVVTDQPDESVDLVVGDAFGGLSVPWHLTTAEFLAEVDRVLRHDGVYVVNVIDGAALRFARAHAATVAHQWEHVAVVVPERGTRASANYVIVGSHAPIPELALVPGDGLVLRDGEVTEWIAGSRRLSDDFAPVDQLIAR